MATIGENVEQQTSPAKKIVEKPVIVEQTTEEVKQVECATNGSAKSPVKTPKKTQPEENGQNGKHAETAENGVATLTEEPVNGVASSEPESVPEVAAEPVEEPEVQEVTNGTSASHKSPTKTSSSPLKKKAEAGDSEDQPEVKKARRSKESKPEEAENGTTEVSEEVSNGNTAEVAK